jgi:type I restriction enzyme S subunit
LNLDKKIINLKFYWHFAQSDKFWDQANKLVLVGVPLQFSANVLKQIIIPIPCSNNPEQSLKIQAEIVRILDAFPRLNNELPARKKQYEYYCKRLKKTNLKNDFEALFKGIKQEIELREKQLKYYRNLLLDFPQPDKVDEPVEEPAQKSLFR